MNAFLKQSFKPGAVPLLLFLVMTSFVWLGIWLGTTVNLAPRIRQMDH